MRTLTCSERALLFTAVAGLSSECRADLSAAESGFVTWSLIRQLPDSVLPLPEENPFLSEVAPDRLDVLRSSLRDWLAMRDGYVWSALGRRIGAILPASDVLPFYMLEICRIARSRNAFDREAMKTYSRLWPTCSRMRLSDELARLPSLAAVCEFMATYKPAGLVPPPPFGLGAEIVIDTPASGWFYASRTEMSANWQEYEIRP